MLVGSRGKSNDPVWNYHGTTIGLNGTSRYDRVYLRVQTIYLHFCGLNQSDRRGDKDQVASLNTLHDTLKEIILPGDIVANVEKLIQTATGSLLNSDDMTEKRTEHNRQALCNIAAEVDVLKARVDGTVCLSPESTRVLLSVIAREKSAPIPEISTPIPETNLNETNPRTGNDIPQAQEIGIDDDVRTLLTTSPTAPTTVSTYLDRHPCYLRQVSSRI